MKVSSRHWTVLLFVLALLFVVILARRMLPARSENPVAGGSSDAPVAILPAPVAARPVEVLEDSPARTVTARRIVWKQMLTVQEDAAIVSLFATHGGWSETDKILDLLSRSQQRHLFERLQSFAASKDRDRVLMIVLVSLANGNSQQGYFLRGLDLISTVTDPSLAKTLADDWLTNWVASNNGDEESARWLMEHGSRYLDKKEVDGYLSRVIRNWSWQGEQPRAAVLFTDRPGFDAETLSALSEAVGSACMWWSYKDLQGVTAWATALPDTDPRKNPALVGMLSGLNAESPEKARAFVEQQIRADNKAALQMARVIGEASSGDNATVAEQWAATLPARARDEVLRSMVYTWLTQLDVEWIADRGTPQVAQWASTLPPNEARGTAWGFAASEWSLYEPAAAKDWLRSLPTGADRDAAVFTYDYAVVEHARVEFPSDPANALESVRNDILDPALSAAQVQSLLVRWAVTADPVSPNEWAASHGATMPVVEGNFH